MKKQSSLLDIITDFSKERSSIVCMGMLEYAVASGLLVWGTKCGGLGLGRNGELLAQAAGSGSSTVDTFVGKS